jgi:hypothetical protein
MKIFVLLLENSVFIFLIDELLYELIYNYNNFNNLIMNSPKVEKTKENFTKKKIDEEGKIINLIFVRNHRVKRFIKRKSRKD